MSAGVPGVVACIRPEAPLAASGQTARDCSELLITYLFSSQFT